MYAGGQFGSSRWLELHRVDQLLSQLTRPSLPGESLPPAVKVQLRELGVRPGRSARREELIAELWGRKRPLMRELYSFDDSPPPCA